MNLPVFFIKNWIYTEINGVFIILILLLPQPFGNHASHSSNREDREHRDRRDRDRHRDRDRDRDNGRSEGGNSIQVRRLYYFNAVPDEEALYKFRKFGKSQFIYLSLLNFEYLFNSIQVRRVVFDWRYCYRKFSNKNKKVEFSVYL